MNAQAKMMLQPKRVANLVVVLVAVSAACGGQIADDVRSDPDSGNHACSRFATPGEACRQESACRWIVTSCRDALGHGYYDSAIKCTADSDCRAPHKKCVTVNIRDCRQESCTEAKQTIGVCWPPPDIPLPDPPEQN